MSQTCRNPCVWPPALQFWQVTLKPSIPSKSKGMAITSEKHCVIRPSRNLCVWQSFLQGWNVTLPIGIAATSDSVTIRSKKNSMAHCRHLGVRQPIIQMWDIALTMTIQATSHCTTITGEKHSMFPTGRNLSVSQSLTQRWNVALSILIASASYSAAITSEKHCMNLYEPNLQKLGCRLFPRSKVECCTDPQHSFREPQRGHHFAAELDGNQSKPAPCSQKKTNVATGTKMILANCNHEQTYMRCSYNKNTKHILRTDEVPSTLWGDSFPQWNAAHHHTQKVTTTFLTNVTPMIFA